MQLIMGLVAIFFAEMIALPEGVGVMWIVIVGLGGLMAHFCITNALAHIEFGVDVKSLPRKARLKYYNVRRSVFCERVESLVELGSFHR